MTITLRGNKSQALTFNELDGNFTDLDGRVTTIEGAYVKTVNGVSPTSNAVTITTANITEVTNLYYTDTRSRAAISITDSGGDGSLSYNSSTGVITYTGPSASEVRAHISVTDSGGDGSLAYNASTGVITYTGPSLAEVQARVNNISIAQLQDVNPTTMNSPVNGHGLVYNSGSGLLELAELPGAAGGEANSGSNVGGFNEVFQGKAGVDFKFRTIDHGDNITIAQSTNALTINVVDSPEFGNLKINSAANTIENISTNANIILKPNGTGVVSIDGALTASGNITGTLATAAQTNVTSLGTLTALQVDNININGNTISSTAGTDLNITPLAGQQIVLDSTIVVDAGVVTGATSITSTALNATSAIIDEVTISSNNITTNASNANLVLLANGTGVVEVDSNIDMNSNKVVNLATPVANSDAATKQYVDTQLSATDLTISTAGDSGSGSVSTSQTLTVAGTSNEIETSASSQTITVGLPSAVTVTTSLSVPTAIIDEVTISGNNITTNATNADLVLVPNGTGTVRTAAIVEIAGEDSLNGEIRFEDSNSSNYVAIKAPDVVASNVTLTLPVDDGTSGQALITDGNGVLSFGAAGAVVTNDESTNAERLVYVGSITSGALTAATQDSGFTYNPSSGTLTAATFNGALSGTAAIATTVTLVETNTTDATHFPVFVDTATGSENPRTDTGFTYNPNSGTLTSTIFSGTATTAQYADLAEKYTCDSEYLPGTVLTVSSNEDAELTAANRTSEYIAGVVSTDPAFLMNSGAEGQAIALVGRVPVRVIGSVNKGQPVFAFDHGTASADGEGKLVGIALETNSNIDEKSVECMLKV